MHIARIFLWIPAAPTDRRHPGSLTPSDEWGGPVCDRTCRILVKSRAPARPARQLAYEHGPAWLEDADAPGYVLGAPTGLPRLCGKPAYRRGGRTVGSTTASGTFLRRVFRLPPHGRDGQPRGLCAFAAPSEAADPRTVSPGFRGHKTRRSEGGPLPGTTGEPGMTLPGP